MPALLTNANRLTAALPGLTESEDDQVVLQAGMQVADDLLGGGLMMGGEQAL